RLRRRVCVRGAVVAVAGGFGQALALGPARRRPVPVGDGGDHVRAAQQLKVVSSRWNTREQAMARFSSFRQFYPYYLQEHRNTVCRRLHFIGSWGVLACLAMALWQWSGG